MQRQLDQLIEKYEAYPVGIGYIDILVLRDRSVAFINDLTELGLGVCSVSWWCHTTADNRKREVAHTGTEDLKPNLAGLVKCATILMHLMSCSPSFLRH